MSLTCGATWAKCLKVWIRLKEGRFWWNASHFYARFYVRVKEVEEESFQAFFRRSTKYRMSEFVEPRTKIHLLNEGYTCVPKTRNFVEDPKEEILGKSKFSGLGGVLKTFYHSTTL